MEVTAVAGAAFIVIVIDETAGVAQPVFPLAVRVRVTTPVCKSFGVNNGVSELVLVSVPDPVNVQSMPELLLVLAPLTV